MSFFLFGLLLGLGVVVLHESEFGRVKVLVLPDEFFLHVRIKVHHKLPVLVGESEKQVSFHLHLLFLPEGAVLVGS